MHILAIICGFVIVGLFVFAGSSVKSIGSPQPRYRDDADY